MTNNELSNLYAAFGIYDKSQKTFNDPTYLQYEWLTRKYVDVTKKQFNPEVLVKDIEYSRVVIRQIIESYKEPITDSSEFSRVVTTLTIHLRLYNTPLSVTPISDDLVVEVVEFIKWQIEQDQMGLGNSIESIDNTMVLTNCIRPFIFYFYNWKPFCEKNDIKFKQNFCFMSESSFDDIEEKLKFFDYGFIMSDKIINGYSTQLYLIEDPVNIDINVLTQKTSMQAFMNSEWFSFPSDLFSSIRDSLTTGEFINIMRENFDQFTDVERVGYLKKLSTSLNISSIILIKEIITNASEEALDKVFTKTYINTFTKKVEKYYINSTTLKWPDSDADYESNTMQILSALEVMVEKKVIDIDICFKIFKNTNVDLLNRFFAKHSDNFSNIQYMYSISKLS